MDLHMYPTELILLYLKRMWYSFLQNYNFSTYTKTAIIALTQIGHEYYTYDANGNPTLVENDSLGTERSMYWDEDNRLMALVSIVFFKSIMHGGKL